MITLDYFDLRDLMKTDMSKEELINAIPMIGADYARTELDDIYMEFFPNRPDLYSVEGVARAMKAYLGKEPGFRQYEVRQSEWKMKVDPSIIPIRPWVACAYVTNLEMDDYLITSLMNMQEKLHLTLGRNRKKVSIGVHDPRNIMHPVTYKAEDPSFAFVPLQMEEKMTMKEILERHPKGVNYRYVVEDFDKYPLITDRNGKVLSCPPIINGIETTVKDTTTELFLDVTGTDWKEVNTALNIVATALAERGGLIHSVEIEYPDETRMTPCLEPQTMTLDPEYPGRILGLDLKPEDVAKLLEKMGYGANIDQEKIIVSVPPYRNDILHPIDLVEDIGIGYGYQNYPHELPKTPTFGGIRKIERETNKLRDLMLGLGFLEQTTFILSSEQMQFTKMDDSYHDAAILKNPLSEHHDCLRVSLLPSLLEIFTANKHRELPQLLFEIGDVVHGTENVRMLGALIQDSKSSFTQVKSYAQYVLDKMDVEYDLKEQDHPSFIPGRCASINWDGEIRGHLGELHPKVIRAFELRNPVVGFEMNLDSLEEK